MNRTILMVHGMWCSGWVWEKFQAFFEGHGYRCIAPTLRFHDMEAAGHPDPRLGRTSLLDYAKDLEELIRGLPRLPIIMGHSMGGLLAQILASRGLAEALVLLSPSPPKGILALRPSVVRSFWSALRKWGFWRKPFRLTYSEMSYSFLNRVPAEARIRLYNRFVFESGRAACEIGFWFLDSKAASGVNEAKVACPILLIAGEQDRIHPLSVARRIAKKYQKASIFRTFPECGHWTIGEPGWNHVAATILAWLDQAKKDVGFRRR